MLISDMRFMLGQICDAIRIGVALLVNSFTRTPSGQKASGRQHSVAVVTAFVLAVSVLIVTFVLDDQSEASCPVEARPRISIGGPASLLSRAKEAKGDSSEWVGAAKTMLDQCSKWQPMLGSTVSVGEMRAQLECQSVLVNVNPDVAVQDALPFIERATTLLASVHGLNQQCETLHQKLRSSRRKASGDPRQAMAGLGELRKFEMPAREGFASIKLVTDIFEQRMEAGDWDAEDSMHEIPSLRVSFRTCLLNVVQEARTIANILPSSNPAVQEVQRCRPDILKGVETLAFAEAELEADPSVIFSAGMLMSEVSLTGNVAFFGDARPESSLWESVGLTSVGSDFAEDAKGMDVPKDIVAAERMLLQGFQATVGPEEVERAALRSIRLSMHAKRLMELNLDAAAEWRYRSAAALAANHGRDKLASHALAQLSYFFAHRKHVEEALKVADRAVELSDDALASYMQVTLRVTLSELRTEEQVRASAAQLRSLKGKLPSAELEETRAATLANLDVWAGVTESDSFSSCLVGDVAQVLICVLGNVAYMV